MRACVCDMQKLHNHHLRISNTNVCVCIIDGRECDDTGVRQWSELIRHSRSLRCREVHTKLTVCLTVGSQEDAVFLGCCLTVISVSQGRADSGKHPEEERMEVNVSLTYESACPTVCRVIFSPVGIDVDLLPYVCVFRCVFT